MECNKGKAVRAKVIAEQKLTEKDYVGAKTFALKAQSLYPELDGLTQMFAILEVYLAGEIKVNGEVDWYSVLGVSPSADDETVRRQYRKLALMFHPDKNKSIGVEGAFKLLSEAWSVLSDKPKRQAYNLRRSANGHQKFPNSAKANPTAVPPPQPRTDTFWTICQHCKSHLENPRIYLDRTLICPNCCGDFLASETTAPNPPPQPRTDTFWTVCHQCKMHYEYFRIYLDYNLICPICCEAFLASETPAPNCNSSSSQTQAGATKEEPEEKTGEEELRIHKRPRRQGPGSSRSRQP